MIAQETQQNFHYSLCFKIKDLFLLYAEPYLNYLEMETSLRAPDIASVGNLHPPLRRA